MKKQSQQPPSHSFPSQSLLSQYIIDPSLLNVKSESPSPPPPSSPLFSHAIPINYNLPLSLPSHFQSLPSHDNYGVFDKKLKRRESHNAVERRRRDHINERIQELGTLVPELGEKVNKGVILKGSVDYIKMLKRELEEERRKGREMRRMLEEYGVRVDGMDSEEKEMGELGDDVFGSLEEMEEMDEMDEI